MRRTQAGATLVELMVSSALGLMILLGVGTLYLGANQSARFSGGVAAIEDAGWSTLALIGEGVRRAGYAEIAGAEFSGRQNLLFDGPHVRGCSAGRSFANPAASDPVAEDFNCIGVTGRRGDVLAVAFQADNVLGPAQAPSFDCVGSAAPARAVPAAFAARVPGGVVPVVQNVFYLTSEGSLMCLGNGNATPQPLLSNVEDFRVFYGFDAAAFVATGASFAPPAASALLGADEIEALIAAGSPSPWDFVVSVHVCLLLRSEARGLSTQAAPTYLPCPRNAAQVLSGTTPVAAPADGALRRAYTQVFTLRSRAARSPVS